MTVTRNINQFALEIVKPVLVFLQVLVRVAPLRPSAVDAVPGVGWWGIYICSAVMSTSVCRKRNCLFPTVDPPFVSSSFHTKYQPHGWAQSRFERRGAQGHHIYYHQNNPQDSSAPNHEKLQRMICARQKITGCSRL